MLKRRLILFAGLLFALASIARASDTVKLDTKTVRLAPGAYARIVNPDGNAVANAGFIEMDHGVLVFDTHFTPEAGKDLLSEIRSVTSKPVRFVINSHGHADHTHGNQVFSGAQLIGSTSTRDSVLNNDIPSMNRTISIAKSQLEDLQKEMKRQVNPAHLLQLREQIKLREQYLTTMSRLEIKAPFVTLDDKLRIQETNLQIEIIFLGNGHTDADTILFLPGERIAFLGDLFFNRAIPNVQDASVLPWMEKLENIVQLEADKFVPGHGPIGSKEDLKNFLHYFRELRSQVEAALAEGYSLEQAIQEIRMPEKYSSYLFQNFFPSNVQKMYTEIKALMLESITIEGPEKPPGEPSADLQ